jgi:Protein of unknown function (DUF2950)
MRLAIGIRRACAVALMSLGATIVVAQSSGDVKAFPTYQAAVDDLLAAVAGNDTVELKALLGPQAENLVDSGDATADENSRKDFLKSYYQRHGFIRESADKVVLTVGRSAWPLPFPIVKTSDTWRFDANEGARELIYRRIGQNELDAMKVSKALYQAQKDYAATGHDGNPPGLYAPRIVSAPGTANGLYWEAKEGEPESPAGSLIANAASEGYDVQHGKPVPFHGYLYRVLRSQGPNAPGGEKDYIQDGKMIGGFAILAYPAEYKASGIMTFMISSHGVVRQRDLGEGTAEAVASIKAYDPDKSWKVVR